MTLPEYTDEYAKNHTGMSLADFLSRNPDAVADKNKQQQSSQNSDPMALAKAAQQLQIEANKPAIQTLQTQYDPSTGKGSLVDKYNDLLDSITASEQPAVDVATQGVNAGLAARGITGNSQLASQELTKTIAPISTQFGQIKAQTGLSEQTDLGNLAAQIAGLQAGNVGNALSFAGGIGQAQTAANAGIQEANIGANASIQNTIAGIQGNLQNTKLQNQFQSVAPGSNLVNTIAGYAINPATLTSKNGGAAKLNNL